MDGEIYFNDLGELAEFLIAFRGSTAKFEVKQDITATKRWILKFLGGF